MSKKYTQKSGVLGWAVVLVSVFAGACLLGWHTVSLLDDVQHARMQVRGVEEKERDSRVGKAFVSEIEANVQLLRAGLADKENPLPVVRSIEDIPNTVPVSIRVTNVRESDGMYGMNITAEGSYTAVYDTLRLIETSPYLLEIQSVVFEQIVSKDVWQLQVSVRAPVAYQTVQ